MKISVIVPTYKPKSYIWECLDSIYNQTLPKNDYELILVLNGCNEPYSTQIRAWLSKHESLGVQFIQTDESGVSNARNLALDHVKGEYVTFIDDDDFISPSFLTELYDKAAPDVVSLCYPYAFNSGALDKQLHYQITKAYNYCQEHKRTRLSSKARKFFSGPCMKLIPVRLIHGRKFDVRFKNGEDSLFMFLISDEIDKVAFTSKNAIYYRRFREESASMTKRTTREKAWNSLKLIREYTRIFMCGGYSLYFYLSRVIAGIIGVCFN